MAKTEKKLQDMKDKVEEQELRELSDEELDRVAGGVVCGNFGSYNPLSNRCDPPKNQND